MKVFVRRFALIGAIVLGAMLQGGCASASKASQQRDFDKQTGVLIQHMKALQAKGDPLGDYYYALANSDGWLKEVTDPKAITQLFEQAAAKGSMDAKILLAMQEAMDEPIPGQLDLHQGPGRNLTQWERGLAQLLPLLQQQCSARRLVLDMGKPRVRYYSIAYKVWPIFRDGRHVQNAQGQYELLVAKNPERQIVWEAIHRNCPIPQNDWLYH
jgi:hypothetical protein